jgi:uracil-DNA glycosylase
MPHDFDPGYRAPNDQLCREFPDETVYPAKDFRIKWGPVCHRGRLDGTARVLAIGQDPAHNKSIVRRILVGTAGLRFQGFLAKLGIDRSYVMINTFLYNVYGQSGGSKHHKDAAIIAYRNRWIDTIFSNNSIDAVIALGTLADEAWQDGKKTTAGSKANPAYAHLTHPTQPDSASNRDKKIQAQLTKTMLANWNMALSTLKPQINHPDVNRSLVPYGDSFLDSELVEIPELDVPPGTPPWMRTAADWSKRKGSSPAIRRATIVVTVPPAFQN